MHAMTYGRLLDQLLAAEARVDQTITHQLGRLIAWAEKEEAIARREAT